MVGGEKMVILMTLSADDLKDVLENVGKFHCIRDALTTCLWDIHPVAPIMLQ